VNASAVVLTGGGRIFFMRNRNGEGREMRQSRMLVGLLATSVFFAWCVAANAFAADAKAEITELEHKCAAATSADEALKCFDASNDLVVYDLMTPREFDGPDAVRTDFQNGFSAFKNPKVEFINLHVFTDGKMGAAESVQHMTATDNSGKPIDMIFRVTDVWRKEKAGWKIIHSHISVPADLATGKADMQSK
jgi:ketosteroid isomerase-like protein